MNKDLKNRVFDLPKEVLEKINHSVTTLNGKNSRGVVRAKTLLQNKKVTYGQLKRIIHDINSLNKQTDIIKYNLYGGQEMENWAKNYLKGERDLISNRKESRKRADNIGGLDGHRKNGYLSTHNKDFSYKIPTNLVKSNSHKTSVSTIQSFKLFEQTEKIKKLIKY